MGTHYMGDFIGDDKSKRDWLKYRTSKWEKNICAITKMLGEYPQESYVAVVCVIQPEWIFLQRVTKDTGCAFLGVEKILQETSRSDEEVRQGRGVLDTRGDILIRRLLEIYTGDIIDTRFGDAEADTYKHKPMDKILFHWNNQNKYKHSNHCHEQRKYFSPFILSVDGMLRKEALVVLSNLSRLVKEKLEETISHVHGWVNC